MWIRFNPNGNGSQNGLTVDGEPVAVQNGRVYVMEQVPGFADSGMTDYFYNDKADKNGKAMGQWWGESDSRHCRFTQIH